MPSDATLVMTFATLDDAESALDWIGIPFIEADGAFEGTLTADHRAAIEEALADPDSPDPVRDLAAALRGRLEAGGADSEASWRVAFER